MRRRKLMALAAVFAISAGTVLASTPANAAAWQNASCSSLGYEWNRIVGSCKPTVSDQGIWTSTTFRYTCWGHPGFYFLSVQIPPSGLSFRSEPLCGGVGITGVSLVA